MSNANSTTKCQNSTDTEAILGKANKHSVSVSLGFLLGNDHCLLLFSRSVVSYSLQPHGLQYDRLPCPSPFPGVCSNSCQLSRWYCPAISSSVISFSSCPQSFPASGAFQISQLFASGGQSIGVSASTSVLPMNTQDWSSFRMDWLDILAVQETLKSLLSHTTVQKHQFFSAQLSSQSNSHIHTWPQEKP